MENAGRAGAAKIDFFISYTAVDQDVAEWIAWVLEEAGYQTVIQAWDFRPGREFITEMQQALVSAQRVLAVLSPIYLGSRFARAEWNAALASDPTGAAGRLLPVRVAEVTLEGLDLPRVYVDLVGLSEEEAKQRLLTGVRAERAKPAVAPGYPERLGQPPATPDDIRLVVARSVDSPTPTPTSERVWNIPAPVRSFTGREDELSMLREQLNAEKRATLVPKVSAAALHGMGGIGKTQLALAYATQHRRDYIVGWWVPAETPLSTVTALTELASRLGVDPELPESEFMAQLGDQLAERHRWLLIFDNAADPVDLEPFFPTADGGHVLLTSRNPAWDGLAEPFGVDLLPLDAAAELLRARTGDPDQQAAEDLAKELGRLPLAVEQAAAYASQQRLGWPGT